MNRHVFRTAHPWAKVAVALAAGLAVCAVGVPLAVAAASPSSASVGISSIVVTGYPLPATPTVTVNGSGFGAQLTGGTPAAQLSDCRSGDTGTDYGKSALWLLDGSRSDGLLGAFQVGANFTPTTGNCSGVLIQSWTHNKVVFKVGSRYASDGVSLTSGDTVCVSIKGVPGCTTLP